MQDKSAKERRNGADGSARNLLAIALAVVIFVTINVWAGTALKSERIDLTEEQLFTLSEGTRQVLASIEEPITLRLYLSKALLELTPGITSHIRRVNELLETYARLSGGLITVERYDPEPFSPEEDLALGDRIQGIAVGDGTQVFLGLAGVNSTDDLVSIAYLAPERADFLEYDLTRMVNDLANPGKPTVGLLGDLALRGTQFNNFTPFAIVDRLLSVAELKTLGAVVTEIPAEVDILLLAEPASADEATLYAIDQFVLRGGRVIAFLDPLSEIILAGRQPGAPAPSASSLEGFQDLLKAWGVEIDPNYIAADREAAVRVQAIHQGRQIITDYLVWMGLPKSRFNSDDVVTSQLQQINLRSPGIIRPLEGATTRLQPLIATGLNSMAVEASRVRGEPDPLGLLRDFEASRENLIIAGRLTGPITSAFPGGAPKAGEGEETDNPGPLPNHLNESEIDVNIILIADSDLLADSTWVQRQNLAGQSYDVALANNADLVVNAVENLAGTDGLQSLRGKGLTVRRFEVLDAMQRQAEDRFRTKEEELQVRIADVQAQIRSLRGDQAAEGDVLTAEEQTAIDTFRNDLLDLRADLREVQFALDQDVKRLQFKIKAINIWAVPALIALIAIVLAFLRKRRHHVYRAVEEA